VALAASQLLLRAAGVIGPADPRKVLACVDSLLVAFFLRQLRGGAVCEDEDELERLLAHCGPLDKDCEAFLRTHACDPSHSRPDFDYSLFNLTNSTYTNCLQVDQDITVAVGQ